MIELILPWPPSVNHYRAIFRNRLITSKDGRDYLARATTYLVFAERLPDGSRIGLEIVAHPPDRRRRDLDNLLKPVLDALTKARVIADDSDIDDLRIVRGPVTLNGELRVTVRAL